MEQFSYLEAHFGHKLTLLYLGALKSRGRVLLHDNPLVAHLATHVLMTSSEL